MELDDDRESARGRIEERGRRDTRPNRPVRVSREDLLALYEEAGDTLQELLDDIGEAEEAVAKAREALERRGIDVPKRKFAVPRANAGARDDEPSGLNKAWEWLKKH